jgi:zinc protease
MRTDDNPQALAGEATAAAIWQTSPYRQPVIGWAADITNLQLPDLRAWYERWYAPANATVVIVGDVDPATMRQLAERYFGPLPKLEVKPPAPRPEVPQRGEKRLQFRDDKVRVPSLSIAFKAPAMTQVGRSGPDGTKVEEWEIYALEVLAAVLDGGSSARFSRHLLRGKQLAASASASYSALSRLEDLFSLDGTPREGVSLAQLEASMREEILEIQRQPPTAEELARVKTQVRAQTIYQQDSLFYQAMTIGALDAVGLPWQLKDRYDAAIAAVTPAQVQAAAKKYLVSERSTVAWLSSAGAAP